MLRFRFNSDDFCFSHSNSSELDTIGNPRLSISAFRAIIHSHEKEKASGFYLKALTIEFLPTHNNKSFSSPSSFFLPVMCFWVLERGKERRDENLPSPGRKGDTARGFFQPCMYFRSRQDGLIGFRYVRETSIREFAFENGSAIWNVFRFLSWRRHWQTLKKFSLCIKSRSVNPNVIAQRQKCILFYYLYTTTLHFWNITHYACRWVNGLIGFRYIKETSMREFAFKNGSAIWNVFRFLSWRRHWQTLKKFSLCIKSRSVNPNVIAQRQKCILFYYLYTTTLHFWNITHYACRWVNGLIGFRYIKETSIREFAFENGSAIWNVFQILSWRRHWQTLKKFLFVSRVVQLIRMLSYNAQNAFFFIIFTQPLFNSGKWHVDVDRCM